MPEFQVEYQWHELLGLDHSVEEQLEQLEQHQYHRVDLLLWAIALRGIYESSLLLAKQHIINISKLQSLLNQKCSQCTAGKKQSLEGFATTSSNLQQDIYINITAKYEQDKGIHRVFGVGTVWVDRFD